MINQGAKPEKIVLGIPAYGRSWSIKEEGWRSMEPPVTAMGAAPAGSEKFKNCIFFPKLFLPTMKKIVQVIHTGTLGLKISHFYTKTAPWLSLVSNDR